jgi:hypothetical protein
MEGYVEDPEAGDVRAAIGGTTLRFTIIGRLKNHQ